MKDILVILIVGFFIVVVQSYDRTVPKYFCEGVRFELHCPRTQRLQMLSANFGRTHKTRCTSKNETFNETNCISIAAKKIIFRKCDGKIFCFMTASSAEMGGDPCPGVVKYVDVMYKCVGKRPGPIVMTTRSLVTDNSSTPPPRTQQKATILPATSDRNIFYGNIIRPNETNARESNKQSNHGFFHSMLVLLVLMKDKPKHSLLSVLTGVAAGTVVVLLTVLVCVCVDKRRQKNESACFRDSEDGKGEAIGLEKSELLGRKKGSNSDSARTDDQVDSAFCDDELDRRVSNDYETTSDMAYLDAYLDEYNKNRSLPRPPVAENDRRNSGPQRMSRRAHNDGSKGRSYDYNENSFTTFS